MNKIPFQNKNFGRLLISISWKVGLILFQNIFKKYFSSNNNKEHTHTLKKNLNL